MTRTLSILAAIVVVAAAGWYLMGGQNTADTTQIPLSGTASAQSTDGTNADIDISTITEMVAGDADSSVTLTEYASFTCPHCAAFHREVYPQLKADYIDTGKIKFVYREVFFDRFGLWASMVARCGDGDKFFGIADLIYKTQKEWTRAGEPAAIAGELRKIGRLAGMDNDTLDVCLQDGEKAKTLVAWWESNGAADEITSTPTFLINGQKHSNMSYDELKKLLDAALDS